MTYFLIFLAICLTWILMWFVVIAVMLHRDPTFSSPQALANDLDPLSHATISREDLSTFYRDFGLVKSILFLPSCELTYFYGLYLIKRNMRLYPELYL